MTSRIFLQLGIATIFFIVLVKQDASAVVTTKAVTKSTTVRAGPQQQTTVRAGTPQQTVAPGGGNKTGQGESAAVFTKCSFAVIAGALSLTTALRL